MRFSINNFLGHIYIMQRFEQNLDRLEALINRFEGGEGGPVSAPASASKPAGGATA